MAGFEICSLVPVVFLLFVFCHISALYCIIVRWIHFFNLWGVFHFSFIHFLVSQLYYNFLKAVLTDPGSPPLDWRPPLRKSFEELCIEEESILREFQPSLNEFCRKCNAYKPPRTRHCMACNRCILKRDHHCILFPLDQQLRRFLQL